MRINERKGRGEGIQDGKVEPNVERPSHHYGLRVEHREGSEEGDVECEFEQCERAGTGGGDDPVLLCVRGEDDFLVCLFHAEDQEVGREREEEDDLLRPAPSLVSYCEASYHRSVSPLSVSSSSNHAEPNQNGKENSPDCRTEVRTQGK